MIQLVAEYARVRNLEEYLTDLWLKRYMESDEYRQLLKELKDRERSIIEGGPNDGGPAGILEGGS